LGLGPVNKKKLIDFGGQLLQQIYVSELNTPKNVEFEVSTYKCNNTFVIDSNAQIYTGKLCIYFFSLVAM
jgi:hypothetical protein